MKRFSILCCLVLLLNVLCPVGHVHAEGATATDLCDHVWCYDESGHYCSKCGSESEKAEHTLETRCVDESGHYDVCTVCSYTSEVSAHWQSCTNPGVCKGCGYEGEMKRTAHKKKKVWVADGEAGCYSACSGCGRKEGKTLEHEASCLDTTHCYYCGYEGEIEHVFHNGDREAIDAQTCGYVCSDCGTQIRGHHYATCEDPTHCYYCGYEGNITFINHTEGKWVYDEEGHYYECPICGIFDKGKHFGSCSDSTHCAYCGYEGEFNDGEHMWLYFDHDEESHWFTCTECKEVITEAHEWGEPVIVEATETTDGSKTCTCVCGATTVEIIPATGTTPCKHEITWVADGANGCYAVCALCDMVDDVFEHEASCTDTTHCIYCGYEGEISSIVHDGECAPINEKSCGYQCNACGEQIRHGHWAYCDNPSVCIYCGYEGEIKNLYHLEGMYSPFDEKTCGYVCSTCGKQVIQYHWAYCDNPTHCIYCGYEGSIHNIMHSEGYWVCDEVGHYQRCPLCNTITFERAHYGTCVDPTHCGDCGIAGEFNDGEHMWDGIEHDADWHWFTCGDCGEFIKEGHDWGEPVVANGSKTYTCVDCGEVKVESITAAGHTHTLGAYMPTGSGAHAQTCTVCGNTIATRCTLVETKLGNLDASACIYCGYITWKADDANGKQKSKVIENATFQLVDKTGAAIEASSLSLVVYESAPEVTIQLDTGANVAVKKALTITVLEDSTPVKLASTAKLSIPMEDDLTGLKLLVMDENGELVEIAYEVVDGVMVFETDILGIFMLVEEI